MPVEFVKLSIGPFIRKCIACLCTVKQDGEVDPMYHGVLFLGDSPPTIPRFGEAPSNPPVKGIFIHILSPNPHPQNTLESPTIPGSLVGGFNPFEKYYIVKMEIFPNFRGENKKYLKPPPSSLLLENQHQFFFSHLEAGDNLLRSFASLWDLRISEESSKRSIWDIKWTR